MSNLIATKRVDLLAPYLELDQGEKVQAECESLLPIKWGGATLGTVGWRKRLDGTNHPVLAGWSDQYCLPKCGVPLPSPPHILHPTHPTSRTMTWLTFQTSGLTEMEACDQRPKLWPRPPPVSTS